MDLICFKATSSKLFEPVVVNETIKSSNLYLASLIPQKALIRFETQLNADNLCAVTFFLIARSHISFDTKCNHKIIIIISINIYIYIFNLILQQNLSYCNKTANTKLNIFNRILRV